ncbi:MFS domain-containing protein [Sergentomyia squamirostris]
MVHIGSQFGAFVSSLLSGFLADNFGWESIFYIFGGLGVVWYALWIYFVKRNPASDPRITVEEKNYIESNLDTSGSHKIPWISMITSKAMIAMIITNVSETMAAYTFLSLTPTYLNNVLKSDLGTTGFITAAPYLICMFFAAGAGVGSDYLRSRNILTTQQVRKTMMGSSFLICAVLIVIMVNLDDPVGICACLILAISFIVVVEVTILCNPLDFAPAYCSVVMGICSPISDISGIVAPMMAGYILKTGSQDEWKIVFYIAVGFCILGTVVFTALGQGTIQPWAKIKSPQMTSEVSEITQI